MDDFNRTSRFSFGGSGPVPVHRLTEYFRHSFSEHLNRAKATHGPRQVLMREGWTRARPGHRQPLTEKDLRIHAWLNERLALLQYERHGLWPKSRRLLRSIARFVLRPFGHKE
jgi:hypothetical protein